MKRAFFTAIMVSILYALVLAPSPSAAADVTSGLIGYWRFDEAAGLAAGDSSGSGNSGAMVNLPVWSSGAIGTSIAFNGVNQYVQMQNPGPLGNPAVALSAWIKTTSSNEQVFFAYGSDRSTGFAEYFRLNVNMTNTNRLGVRSGNGRRSFFAPGIANGYWHHVVIQKAEGDTITNLKAYMDGVLLVGAEDSNPGIPWNIGAGSPTIPITIGGDVQADGIVWPFNGSIDDVRLYNRVLSAADVTELYNAAPPQFAATLTPCTGSWSLTRQEPPTCRPYADSLWTKRLPSDVFRYRQSNSEAAIDSIFRAKDAYDKLSWLQLIWATPGGNDVIGAPMNYGQASDPLYRVSCDFPGRECATGLYNPGQFYFHLPVGSRFTTVNPGEDAFYTVWDQVNNRILGIYKVMDDAGPDSPNNRVQPCAGTTPETACELTLTGAMSTNSYTDAAEAIQNVGSRYGDSLRSGINAMTIKASELMAGQISHALYLIVDCINDGNTTSVDGVVEGINVFPSVPNGGGWGCSSTYRGVTRPDLNPKRPFRGNLIFADYTDAQIDAMNIPDHNKTLLRAMTRYGGYVGDEQRPDNPGMVIGRYESMQPYSDLLGLEGTQIPIWNWLQNVEHVSCSVGGPSDSRCRFFLGLVSGVPDLPGPLCPTSACGPTKHFHIADPCVPKGMLGLAGGCGGGPIPLYVTPPTGVRVTNP